MGILPTGYIYPKEEIAVRDLLRKRGQLVRQKTSNLEGCLWVTLRLRPFARPTFHTGVSSGGQEDGFTKPIHHEGRRNVRRKRSTKGGLPPGTPVHIGVPRGDTVRFSLVSFGEEDCHEEEFFSIKERLDHLSEGRTVWITIRGVHQVDRLQELAAAFELHPLVLEDIVNTEQRPKLEDYGSYLFVVLKRLDWSRTHELEAEQISLVLGKGFVLVFQESPEPLFPRVLEDLRKGTGRLRKNGSDFLAYRLLDSIVDQYFSILEQFGESVEQLEDRVVSGESDDALHAVHRLKRQVIILRKVIWPLREVVSRLGRAESRLVRESTLLYLRDVHDHTVQIMETTEMYRDVLGGLQEIYLSSLSNKLNEAMKVLTMIATLFIPLTFIAGIYGMNFTYMPELEWPWAYPLVLVVMLSIAGGFLVFFRGKGWM